MQQKKMRPHKLEPLESSVSQEKVKIGRVPLWRHSGAHSQCAPDQWLSCAPPKLRLSQTWMQNAWWRVKGGSDSCGGWQKWWQLASLIELSCFQWPNHAHFTNVMGQHSTVSLGMPFQIEIDRKSLFQTFFAGFSRLSKIELRGKSNWGNSNSLDCVRFQDCSKNMSQIHVCS